MTKSWIPNFLVVALSVLLAGVAHAGINQWTATGPVGRSVSALAVDPQTPTTVYAGTDQGVFIAVFKWVRPDTHNVQTIREYRAR